MGHRVRWVCRVYALNGFVGLLGLLELLELLGFIEFIEKETQDFFLLDFLPFWVEEWPS